MGLIIGLKHGKALWIGQEAILCIGTAGYNTARFITRQGDTFSITSKNNALVAGAIICLNKILTRQVRICIEADEDITVHRCSPQELCCKISLLDIVTQPDGKRVAICPTCEQVFVLSPRPNVWVPYVKSRSSVPFRKIATLLGYRSIVDRDELKTFLQSRRQHLDWEDVTEKVFALATSGLC
jgi:hypothetical protein